ncbi:MAG: PHP domain-containing protein [Brevefilum sp.]|nr:PHP domain-containing protein [Brevefilum sp.]MDT8381542.1 PHP domain-containing protein [Brevefilum sp.]MDW7753994.1 PHP domain-containing protein [Brevefilum sp.]
MMHTQNKQSLRVELHCHTSASVDSLVSVEKILSRCKTLGINKIAITDHNVIHAAQSAKAMAPDMVIVGEEIQTTKGELIAYLVSEWVPPGLDPKETIERLREQGAVISIPHPFDPFRGKDWDPGDLEGLAPYIDAVETFNARCFGKQANLTAADFGRHHGLLETVGSDAHTLRELGRATLRMPDFSDAESFRAGLRQAEKITQHSPIFIHFYSRFAKLIKKFQKAI